MEEQKHIQKTYKADIYVGLKEGYDGYVADMDDVLAFVKKICNGFKIGVTLTTTRFVYVDGDEPGIIVGLINYPRFPSTPEEIKDKALRIASVLAEKYKQERVSIVCTDETIMLGDK